LPIPWNDDPQGSDPQIFANGQRIVVELLTAARQRDAPSLELARRWHREFYAGVTLPVPYYAGEFRDSDPSMPNLFGYEVGVGSSPGVRSAAVPAELGRFVGAMSSAVASLDSAIAVGQPPANLSRAELEAVLRLAAIAHGEWIRIHPFANGNGRTARLWANWVAARYGLPAFVILKPRPTGPAYAGAALRSMQGDHDRMFGVFHQMFVDYMAQGSSTP
jgi:fido (protein-threonine AMPylation protein)